MRLFHRLSQTAIILGILMLSGVITGCGSKKEESYRSIQVYNIDGTGWVSREGTGEMELYVNMQLQSHDQLWTDSESYVQLKLDEDKYVLVEPNTRIRIEAEGNATDSRTKIVLEEGAVVNRIENKLSENSSYEVETPNSTMAVRGTTFRVTIVKDKAGKLVSEVEVQDGKVECKIIVKNEDGTTKEQTVTLEAGKKTIIEGTLEGAERVEEAVSYTYHAYESEVLNFIGYSEDQNQETESLPQEAGEGDESKQEDAENQKDTQNSDDISQKQKEEDEKQDKDKENNSAGSVAESESQQKKDKTENQIGDTENKVPAQNTNTDNNSGSTDSGSNSGSSGDSGSTDSGSNSGSSGDSGSDSGSSGDSGSDSGSSGDSGSTDSGSNSGSSGDSGSTDSGSNSGSSGDSGTTPSVTYTVTFVYGGSTVGTQSVTSGGTATPAQSQTSSGYWSEDGSTEFNFGTVITGTVTLTWIDTTPATPAQHTVTFLYGGNTVGTQSITSGGTATPVQSQTSSGYWSEDGSTEFDFGTAITGTVTLTWIDTTTYTVTFTYGGNTFATQMVESGKCAVRPILMPTADGYWSLDGSAKFNFETPITTPTTLTWVSN